MKATILFVYARLFFMTPSLSFSKTKHIISSILQWGDQCALFHQILLYMFSHNLQKQIEKQYNISIYHFENKIQICLTFISIVSGL